MGALYGWPYSGPTTSASFRTSAAGSSAPKTAEPATNRSAPAPAQAPAVLASIPPSTSSAGPVAHQRAQPLELVQRVRQERLAAPAGVHRHAQHEVHVAGDLGHGAGRRAGIDGQARPAARVAHRAERVVDVGRRLGVDA